MQLRFRRSNVRSRLSARESGGRFNGAARGAYGFIKASLSETSGYNPHAFAIGASFLFALACVEIGRAHV